MKTFFPCGLLVITGTIIATAETVTFDNSKPGDLPAGWTSAMTHNGGAPRWAVRGDDTAPSKPNVLAQLSDDRTSGRFPLAIYDKASLKDGEVSVKCKPISGRGDQACGLVWRYRDPNNYYIVRSNALENNIVLYKVENGERKSIAPKGTASRTYGVKHPVPKATWSEMRATFSGNRIAIYFNGKQVFEAEDNTFGDAGKVGLWTKADSVTHFDDFTFTQR
jgi:Domain of Unknown Function (DUF1080)